MQIIYKDKSDAITGHDLSTVELNDSQVLSEIRKPQIEIRKATPEDAAFIAATVMSAMGHEAGALAMESESHVATDEAQKDILTVLTDICKREDTLYSYRNVYIATYGGKIAGSLISYDGALYKELADRTFGIVAKEMNREKFNPGTETKEGEYYLDSLSVLPEFRGHNIGSVLMQNALEVAEGLGFTLVSLIVDKEKPWLHKLYSRLGFQFDGELEFFGEPYYRMIQYLA